MTRPWNAVHGYENGVPNDAEHLNTPIYELTSRTDYLYSVLSDMLAAGTLSSLTLPNVGLSATDSPVVGDVVYLDPITKLYVKALASMSAVDLFSSNTSCYAIGMLSAVSGSTGTVVTSGKITLASNGSPWTVASLLQSGETFRNGPYYLSSLEAGKLTATPLGPAIYVGYFTANATDTTKADFAILTPQYKDIKESHTHRPYKLFTQPVGTQTVTGTLPTDTHSVHGFDPILPVTGHIPKLVIGGSWTGAEAAAYTLWLSNSTSSARAASVGTLTFSNLYLRWESSDVLEGSGYVRVVSYDTVVAFGTKGLTACLENNTGADWDDPYTPSYGDAPDQRSWLITAPDQVVGWVANSNREVCTPHADAREYTLIVRGGPYTAAGSRSSEAIVAKCTKMFTLTYTTNATVGDILTMSGTNFEFVSIGLPTGTNTPVRLGNDVEESATNLMNAILALGLTDVDVCIDYGNSALMLGTIGANPTLTGSVWATIGVTAITGPGSLTGGADFMVYDSDHINLVDGATHWAGAVYWTPVTLTNGLQVMAIPFNMAGVDATDHIVAQSEYWDAEFAVEANGAKFKYLVATHQGLSQFYPPIPLESAVLVLNGVELDSTSLFGDGTYKVGNSGIYWYDDAYGLVPWSRDWVSTDSPGSYDLRMVFHSLRMGLGNFGLVTSIKPADGSPITLKQSGTNQDATTGDLQINIDLALQGKDAAEAGYQVVKAATGNALLRGPVVERIIAGPGVTVTQQAGAPAGQGTVTISAGAGFEGDFEEVALENAKQELVGMFPYIRLLDWTTGGSTNIPTSFIAKFVVPYNAAGQYQVLVYATVFGETAIPYGPSPAAKNAGITFNYNIMPNEVGSTLVSGIIAPSSPRNCYIPLGVVPATPLPIYEAYAPMVVHNNSSEGPDVPGQLVQALGNPFPSVLESGIAGVQAGDIVAIQITRASTSQTPEYVNKVGFIKLRWKLVMI